MQNIMSFLSCIREITIICATCRFMDQLPNHNIGAACRGYLDCIGNAFKSCFNAMSEKCADCFHHNDSAVPPHVELAGSNVNDNTEGQA